MPEHLRTAAAESHRRGRGLWVARIASSSPEPAGDQPVCKGRPASLEQSLRSSANLWRFGGDLGHAAQVTADWSAQAPQSARPSLRAGEIAFLRGRYDDAEH